MYVSKSGNDPNSGTTAKPLLTIQAAINKSEAGTAIMISEGIYEESISFGNKKGRLDALSKKFEGRRITVKENEILASPNRQLAIQFMACEDCTLEKNKIHAKSDYFSDVGLLESFATHTKGSGWLPRTISLRYNCVGRSNWLFKEDGVSAPTENSNNNSTGCN